MLEENPMYYKYLINTMLSTLDPYSAYHEQSTHFLDPENAQTGFGFTVASNPDGKGAIVNKVLPGTNADEAGIRDGDKFLSIAGYNVENLPLEVAMSILRNPHHFILGRNEKGGYDSYNPECEIVLERKGVHYTVKLTKGPMQLDQISSSIIENEGGPVGYIQLSSFLGTDLTQKFNQAVKGFADSGIKRLTIDLRNNSGGSLDYALQMAEILLDENELICYYNDRNQEEPKPIYSTTPKIAFDSVTVLVNERTASAAELMASILQTRNVAKIIGKKTVGKGIGQTVYGLTNGDYITITTYEILDSNLYNYNGKGIIPDLTIDNVELYYELPKLSVFNHTNYKEIKEGIYSEPALALEQRLQIMGYLYEEDADGIFDKTTSDALRVLQRLENIEVTGNVTHSTVTKITDIINEFKEYTYFEDSQLDVALIVHRSFSQGKRLVAEKTKLAEQNAKLIEENRQRLIEEFDKAEAEKNAASAS
jgi:carboxyl-terminal processing protease